MNLPIELKTRIYDHIGTVQKHLGQFPPDEQREILQSLEAHIHDALESRSGGDPTMDLLEAIIAEIDPPESYGSDQQPPATHPHPEQDQPALTPTKAQGKSVKRLIVVTVIVFISFFTIMLGISIVTMIWSVVAGAAPPAGGMGISSPTGHWKSIDFVEDTGQFDPSSMHFQGELKLKGITFLEDGTTSKSWWTWKNNLLIHHGDKSAAQFSIKTMNGAEYMFLEWISGDVLEKGMSPKYYVLKRGEYVDQE